MCMKPKNEMDRETYMHYLLDAPVEEIFEFLCRILICRKKHVFLIPYTANCGEGSQSTKCICRKAKSL